MEAIAEVTTTDETLDGLTPQELAAIASEESAQYNATVLRNAIRIVKFRRRLTTSQLAAALRLSRRQMENWCRCESCRPFPFRVRMALLASLGEEAVR